MTGALDGSEDGLDDGLRLGRADGLAVGRIVFFFPILAQTCALGVELHMMTKNARAVVNVTRFTDNIMVDAKTPLWQPREKKEEKIQPLQ